MRPSWLDSCVSTFLDRFGLFSLALGLDGIEIALFRHFRELDKVERTVRIQLFSNKVYSGIGRYHYRCALSLLAINLIARG